jgi:hypothetical protein
MLTSWEMYVYVHCTLYPSAIGSDHGKSWSCKSKWEWNCVGGRQFFSREKWRGVAGLNTGSFISLVLLWRWRRGRSNSSGRGRHSRLKGHPYPLQAGPKTPSWLYVHLKVVVYVRSCLWSLQCVQSRGREAVAPRQELPSTLMWHDGRARIRRVFERSNVYVQYVNCGITKKFSEGYKSL